MSKPWPSGRSHRDGATKYLLWPRRYHTARKHTHNSWYIPVVPAMRTLALQANRRITIAVGWPCCVCCVPIDRTHNTCTRTDACTCTCLHTWRWRTAMQRLAASSLSPVSCGASQVWRQGSVGSGVLFPGTSDIGALRPRADNRLGRLP